VEDSFGTGIQKHIPQYDKCLRFSSDYIEKNFVYDNFLPLVDSFLEFAFHIALVFLFFVY
jgi:hypothetical protein